VLKRIAPFGCTYLANSPWLDQGFSRPHARLISMSPDVPSFGCLPVTAPNIAIPITCATRDHLDDADRGIVRALPKCLRPRRPQFLDLGAVVLHRRVAKGLPTGKSKMPSANPVSDLSLVVVVKVRDGDNLVDCI
jgi:hypothetical protein